MAKKKKFRLTMIFHNIEDLQEHVAISCDLDLSIKKADWLDINLPARNFKIEDYVLTKIKKVIGGTHATSN
jgi:hypothetical protein